VTQCSISFIVVAANSAQVYVLPPRYRHPPSNTEAIFSAPLLSPRGYVQHNPWQTISNRQLEVLHNFTCELGLSNVARKRVQT
jgi:hypothetical protein